MSASHESWKGELEALEAEVERLEAQILNRRHASYRKADDHCEVPQSAD